MFDFIMSLVNLLSWVCLGVLAIMFYYERERERIAQRIRETDIDKRLEQLVYEVNELPRTAPPAEPTEDKKELLAAIVHLLSMTGTRYASRRVVFGEEWMPHPVEVQDEDILNAMQVVLKTAHELKDEFALAMLCDKKDLEALGYIASDKKKN